PGNVVIQSGKCLPQIQPTNATTIRHRCRIDMIVLRKLAVFFLATTSMLSAATPRETSNFNRAWKFQIGDHAGAEAVAFNDANWEAIGLPHSFSMPYFAAGNAFYVGYGWYRKHFDVPVAW